MNFFEEALQMLMVFALSLPRIMATFALFPMFSRQILPGPVRTAVVATLTLFMFPAVSHSAQAVDFSVYLYLLIGLKEAFIGLLIGYGAAAIFWAVESMGFLIDNQRGATMASSVDPLTGSQTSPLAIFMVQTFAALFFVAGGFLVFLGALYASYQVWPVFSFYPAVKMTAVPYFLTVLDNIMALALVIAAPVMIAAFLSEFALALISRFAPTLNVFFLSMGIKSGVGFLVLILYMGLLIAFLGDEFREIPSHFTFLRGVFE